MRALFNNANSNLRGVQQHGDKIILWNGAEDNVVQPADTIHYYLSVQREMGVAATDTFMRFFLLLGVGHWGGGDGANQVDISTPLMAWVETKQAHVIIVAGKTVPRLASVRRQRPAG